MPEGFGEGGPVQAPKQEEDPKKRALNHIEMIRQQCAVMGFNDSEWGRLDEIRNKLNEDQISPEEAETQADAIFAGKQDYH